MATLHLGVIDLLYQNVANGTSTGDVAEWLEENYAIMETFFERYQEQIATLLAESVAGGLESILMGATVELDVFGEGMDGIKDLFQKFLDQKEMDGIAGIPTQASLLGISHRFKDKQGEPGRPSFIDTGLYVGSFKAWISEE